MQYVISSYFMCRMENRDHANQEEEMKNEVVDECEEEQELMVTDEWKEEARAASAGKGLIHILLQFNKNT